MRYWLSNIREFIYLLRKGVFVVQMYNYHLEYIDGQRQPIHIMDGKPLYLNARGRDFSFTHSPKGATTVTLIAGWLLCRTLRKRYPRKHIGLVTVQDVAFIEHVFYGE